MEDGADQYFGTNGYATARCAKRMPASARWAHASVARVNITPYFLHTPAEQAPSMKDPGVVPMGEQVKDPRLHPRNLRPTARDFAAHGYTPGCRNCALAERFGWERATGDHSQECRGRIEAALMNTPEGMQRLQKVIERFVKSKDAAPEAAKPPTAAAAGGGHAS